jgi:hypothetical protein
VSVIKYCIKAIFKLVNFKSLITAKIRQIEIISLMIQFLSLKYQANERASPIEKEMQSMILIVISLIVIKPLDKLEILNKNSN